MIVNTSTNPSLLRNKNPILKTTCCVSCKFTLLDCKNMADGRR